MSGGAAKRAKRGEKDQLSESGQAVLNAMIAGDGNALHKAMYPAMYPLPQNEAMDLLPQRIPNVAASGQSVVAPPLAQVGEKRRYEPNYVQDEIKDEIHQMKAREKAAMRGMKEQIILCTRVEAGDQTMHTEIFCNNRSLSPLHEACRATIQRVEPKNTFAKGHLKLHKKVLREELLLRADDIREDQARREQHIKKQSDELKIEKEFFEENICDLKQKASMQFKEAAREESAKARDSVHCAQS